jgi:hypothetical protein
LPRGTPVVVDRIEWIEARPYVVITWNERTAYGIRGRSGWALPFASAGGPNFAPITRALGKRPGVATAARRISACEAFENAIRLGLTSMVVEALRMKCEAERIASSSSDAVGRRLSAVGAIGQGPIARGVAMCAAPGGCFAESDQTRYGLYVPRTLQYGELVLVVLPPGLSPPGTEAASHAIDPRYLTEIRFNDGLRGWVDARVLSQTMFAPPVTQSAAPPTGPILQALGKRQVPGARPVPVRTPCEQYENAVRLGLPAPVIDALRRRCEAQQA